MHVSFTDGSKNEDISKVDHSKSLLTLEGQQDSLFQVVLYALHTVLLEDENPVAYLLLRCLRSYSILDMYAALEVHTSDTIAAAEAEVLRFSSLMRVGYL